MAVDAETGKRPSGRRGGNSGTREAILDSAGTCFAERGYRRRRCGPSRRRPMSTPLSSVTSSATRTHCSRPSSRIAPTSSSASRGSLAGDENSIGLRVTDTYLRMWEEADSRPVVLAIVRSAMASDHAAEMLLEALGGKIRAKIARTHGAHRSRWFTLVRVGGGQAHHQTASGCPNGFRLPRVGVAPTIQRHLTGSHLDSHFLNT